MTVACAEQTSMMQDLIDVFTKHDAILSVSFDDCYCTINIVSRHSDEVVTLSPSECDLYEVADKIIDKI